ncbi:hypothetical protein ONS95_010654 [Cadophora gregata]|uniref:uncharacterized protein n=2 Tax=Cadophora gregata TaxID=51156 RepID=UPI0026DB44A3|nr:uncharacterized protein ONS95_010654 [Cadophora gregata]KAK0122418.1 hypothetical protein ONS95_010654 [Cadophora gregata]
MSNDRRHLDNLSAYNFNSTRATPKESRPRARQNDRSRSPQRDRFPSGRYDRVEGGSGVRSPSDSSPYRQSDRPAVARTNSASLEQPLRAAEAGISILGRAAKAEEERKQREEQAKLYKAKAAMQKAAVSEQGSSTIEVAAPAMASVDRAGATDLARHDEAKRAESALVQHTALSTKNDVLLGSQPFVDSIGDILVEVSELCSAKSLVEKSKARLNKAVAEFDKSKENHERWPSIKDPQVQAKKTADREHKKAVKESEQKEASLRRAAEQVAEKVLPSILGSSTQELQQTRDRLNTVEGKCESSHRILDDRLQEQKAYFDAQHLKSNDLNEKIQKELKEEIRVLRAEFTRERSRTEKLFSMQSEFATTIQNLSEDLKLAKETIARFSQAVPPDLTEQLRKISGLDQLRSEVKAYDGRSSRTEAGMTNLTATVNNLTHSVGALDRTSKARDNVAQTLSEEQNDLRRTITQIDDRVKVVEDNAALKKVENRISSLERTAYQSAAANKDHDAVKQQLVALEATLRPVVSRSSNIEEIDGLKIKLNGLESSVTSATDRIAKVEEQTKAWEGVQKTSSTQKNRNSPDLTALEIRLAAIEQKPQSGTPDPSIGDRILALERERRLQAPLAQSSVTVADFSHLSNQVDQLKNDMAEDIAALVDSTGSTVETLVNHHLQPIMERVSTVESSLQSLEDSNGSVQASFKILEESNASIQSSVKTLNDSYAPMQSYVQTLQKSVDEQFQRQNKAISDAVGAAAGRAIEVIRSQNLYAPASLDAKFATTIQEISTHLDKYIEAQSQITDSLQFRMDNMNTGELHRAMVDSIGQTFPNLRNHDMTLQSLNSQMSTIGIKLRAIQTEFSELKESRQAPAPAPAPAPAVSPAPASRQDDGMLKALRTDVDTHTLDLHRLKKLLEKDVATMSATTSASLAGAHQAISDLTEELARRCFELQTSDEDLDGKIHSLNDKIEGIDKKVDGVIHKQQQPSRAPSAIPRTTFAGSRQASAQTNRQASVSSDASSVLRKRKAQDLNGNGGPAVSPRKPTNGFRHSSESARGSPNAKRPRRNKLDDDPEMDPDYEEGDPQPGISADEDEDE